MNNLASFISLSEGRDQSKEEKNSLAFPSDIQSMKPPDWELRFTIDYVISFFFIDSHHFQPVDWVAQSNMLPLSLKAIAGITTGTTNSDRRAKECESNFPTFTFLTPHHSTLVVVVLVV